MPGPLPSLFLCFLMLLFFDSIPAPPNFSSPLTHTSSSVNTLKSSSFDKFTGVRRENTNTCSSFVPPFMSPSPPPPPGCSDHASHGPHNVHAACQHDGPYHPTDEPSVPGHYRKCEYSLWNRLLIRAARSSVTAATVFFWSCLYTVFTLLRPLKEKQLHLIDAYRLESFI